MKAVALQARDLAVSLGGAAVLQGMDVAFAAGRWTSIVGPNGAGKSTLLKALAGLLRCHGEVTLLGQPTQRWTRTAKARAMSWLGQGEVVAADLTAHDVVMLGRLPHQAWLGGPCAADRDAVERAMRMTQSWDWRDRPLGALSGGERQRVLLARALAVQAQVLLMDEPLANLDPPHQADWLAVVRELVQSGHTVISVLHEISLALQADDLLILRQGRVFHQGACANVASHRALEAVFDHRVAVQPLQGQWVALPRL